MFASRASAERPLTPRASPFSSGATWLESWLARDLYWLVAMGFLYALAVIAGTLCLNRYFSQTWDAVTFASAARNLLGMDWAGLYAHTRVEQQWPFAYPPLHAAVIAPLLLLSRWVPDWLLVRLPPLLADIAVGLIVYTLIARKTGDRSLARLGNAVWLLNPLTYYDTAVQGHFEAEWLVFVLAGYLLAGSRRGLLWASLAFATAFLFKQIAIIFVLPYWIELLIRPAEKALSLRVTTVILSGVIFAVPVLVISLPFLLYSGDYLYMNLQYVAEVPLQTQSWLVAVHGLLGGDFWLLQHLALLVALAALILSFISIRRGASLHRVALLIAIAFFLLSQKVMGYYYVMLLPFALVELIPARRTGLLAVVVAAMAWISLSPYFASWAKPEHWPIYAALGILNSLFWLGTAIYVWHNVPGSAPGVSTPPIANGSVDSEPKSRTRLLAFISILIFFLAVAASLAQPLVNSSASPIRSPLLAPGTEQTVLLAAAVLVLLAALAVVLAVVLSRWIASSPPIPKLAFILALVYLPLYFLTFTLTKESTAAFELVLKSLGL